MTGTAYTVWSKSLLCLTPGLLLRRRGAVLPCRSADIRCHHPSQEPSNPLLVSRAAGHNERPSVRSCGSRRSGCCRGSDWGIERPLACTILKGIGNVTSMTDWLDIGYNEEHTMYGVLHIPSPPHPSCFLVRHSRTAAGKKVRMTRRNVPTKLLKKCCHLFQFESPRSDYLSQVIIMYSCCTCCITPSCRQK